MSLATDTLSFLVEWKEPCSAVPREFILTYYPKESGVSMFDLKRRKLFLRKIECETVSLKNIFIGNVIQVLSRNLLVKSYADVLTETFFESALERVLAGVSEHGFKDLGVIITEIHKLNLLVRKIKMIRPNESDTQFFLKWLGDSSRKLVNDHVQPGRPVLLMELGGYNCVSKWKGIQSSVMRPLLFGSANKDCVRDELNILFSDNRPLHCNTALFANSTCCVIKPHIILNNLGGEVISFILENNFVISALEMFNLTRQQADDFFQIYKGILPYYNELLDEMTTGSCIVMEIWSNEDTQRKFRELVGPHDSQLAKQARPDSLRAHYGIDRIKNAVHCTDLSEDAILELEYFFRILPKYKSKELK